MKKIILLLALLLFSIGSNAQFVNGQILTAPALNAALAAPNITGGTINGAIIGGINPPSATLNNLTVNGTFTPGSGTISLSGLVAQAANTLVANTTSSSASPTAVSLPSCSTTSSAILYTSNTGFSCNTTINATSLGGNSAASYALLASPTFTGTPIAPTATAGTNTTQLATTAFVATSFAPLASPALTGTPTAPTASPGTNTTQLATTAFDTAAIAAALPGGWTSYTPSISANSGTYTSASATGGYMKLGKLVCIWATATITTVGTGTATVLGLPFTSASVNSGYEILPGRENNISGKMLQGVVPNNSSTMTIFDYSNLSAAASGASEVISGCYIST